MGATSTYAWDSGTALGGSSSVVSNLKVFKAETFKDSRGRQKTWTAADLKSMVDNFNALVQRGIFPKVPVRVDHSDSAKNVVGWISALRSDDQFLYADVSFTEPEAAAKYQRGTYGPRSLEVGEYETNGAQPEVFFPVVMGLAFVDIPAVEGLYRNQTDVMFAQVTVEGDRQMKFKIKGVETEDGTAIQAYIAELEAQAPKAATKFRVNGADVEDFAAVQKHVLDLEAKVAEFAKSGSFTFKVNGAETTDFAAVQAHVANLETVIDESRKTNRGAFVKKLADDKKIGAPQVESLTAVAQGMSDEQYAAFQASYEAAPVLSLFGNHAGGTTNHAGTATEPGGASELEKEIATYAQRVDILRRSGMSKDQLEKTESFQRLAALKAGK